MKLRWVVVYDPSINEEKPYYTGIYFGDTPGQGGPSGFFSTEEEAIQSCKAAAARTKRMAELRAMRKIVWSEDLA